MNKTSDQKFVEALDICQSLIDFKYRPTNLTYQAIELFCEIGKNPFELLELCQKYSSNGVDENSKLRLTQITRNRGYRYNKHLLFSSVHPRGLSFLSKELKELFSPKTFQRSSKIDKICQIINEYATSIDNWRVDCPLGFGAKDHCSFLSFFLNLDRCQFEYFTDNFTTPEQIAELFKDWKGIDFNPVIEKQKIVTF
ncbi:hypothetical protein [Trichormus sp. NMC-1]|uniref:hypothetical protein n=1 Tax=Trichormus sp. NMC-1 TaxID=1853259 RepID=UPI0008DBF84A|nr:hypothetical protein [Trichormus sp. NMC-1]